VVIDPTTGRRALVPCSWGTLLDFRTFSGRRITEDEAVAVMYLDDAKLNPDAKIAEDAG
jgi:hypothetical protein